MVTFGVVFAVIALGQQVAFSAEANEPVNRTFTAEQTRSLQENIVEGSFSGIGIEIGMWPTVRRNTQRAEVRNYIAARRATGA